MYWKVQCHSASSEFVSRNRGELRASVSDMEISEFSKDRAKEALSARVLKGLGEHCAHASRRRQNLQKRRHALHPQLDCPYHVGCTEAIPEPEMQSTGPQDSTPTTR
ncbi:hypothetical protein VCV18_004878 [Metarhizium anisopliae]